MFYGLRRNGKRMSDIFGFEKAIQIDHLTDEQIETLENIFKDYQ
jgi:hypothetical protein